MRVIVSLGVLASALLNAVAIVIGRGSFVHMFAVLATALYVGLPALVIAVSAYALRNRFRFASLLARTAALVAVVAVSTLISIVPGQAIANRDIAAAKNYCELLIPKIDEYQRTHGAYPVDLSLIARSGEVPRLLRGFNYYYSDGSKFIINFGDPRGLMNFVGYDSDTRMWSEWH